MKEVFKNWMSILEVSPKDFVNSFKEVVIDNDKGVFVKNNIKVIVYPNKVKVFKEDEEVIKEYHNIHASNFLSSFYIFGRQAMEEIKEEREKERQQKELEERKKIEKDLLL